MNQVPATLRAHPKSRFWFYRPQWYWFGWRTLVPMRFGHDEWSRKALLLGWTITGEIVIALGYCGDPDCYEYSVALIEDDLA